MSISIFRGNPVAQSAHAADVAQARLFIVLLQEEADTLDQLLAAAETRWLQRCERNRDNYRRPPDSLVRFRERSAEVQKLLENLRTRFLPD